MVGDLLQRGHQQQERGAPLQPVDQCGARCWCHGFERDQAVGQVAVVAGFQGLAPDNRITTLGRGGSDTSAVALAAALKADRCDIYTDVDGVYTTDPNICPTARKIDRISFEEMLELASLGAKVLQIRSVEIAMKYNVPIHVRTSFSDAPGTMVTSEEGLEAVTVAGVAYDKAEARVHLVGVEDKPGVSAFLFEKIAEQNISVDMIIQNVSRSDANRTDVTFTMPERSLLARWGLKSKERCIGASRLIEISCSWRCHTCSSRSRGV
jgi:aspartate kinase